MEGLNIIGLGRWNWALQENQGSKTQRAKELLMGKKVPCVGNITKRGKSDKY
jgi:hypothetical protein